MLGQDSAGEDRIRVIGPEIETCIGDVGLGGVKVIEWRRRREDAYELVVDLEKGRGELVKHILYNNRGTCARYMCTSIFTIFPFLSYFSCNVFTQPNVDMMP